MGTGSTTPESKSPNRVRSWGVLLDGRTSIQRGEQFVNRGFGQAGGLIRGAVINPDTAIVEGYDAIAEDHPVEESLRFVVGLRFEQQARRAFEDPTRSRQIEH